MMIRCAVFLDKDGTLIDDVPYNIVAGDTAEAARLIAPDAPSIPTLKTQRTGAHP
jgi:hypothetical protein